MEEDDFGELYGDPTPAVPTGAASLQKAYSGYAFFDDEIDEDKGHVATPVVHTRPSRPSPAPLPTTKPQAHSKLPDVLFRPDQPAERDSDEDDDMLLLGYNCKSGSAGSKIQANDTQAMVTDDPEEEFAKFAELSKSEDVIENGLVSLSTNSSRAVAVCVPGITPTQELTSISCRNPLDGPNGSPDVTIHTITIPGLSTTVNAPFFDMGDNGDVAQDAWEEGQTGKPHLRSDGDVAVAGADDWDTDSDDDLRIVLNTEYPFYTPGEKGAVGKYEGGSEDEDDEDLIIFAGGEPNEEGEDPLLQPLDVQAIQGDGLGEKQTSVEDGKGQQDKVLSGVPVPPQAPRGYGYHNYNSPYKYVRAGASAVYSAPAGQAPGGRGGPLKLINGRGDWRGSGRGSYGPHLTSQFSPWSAPSNFEYTLPPSMTVFDIDLEAFEDKPWRQSAVDVSDFFNFGFDETTWNDYCKQLAQLRLESTMQSKIRVYESGRSEQDYDPDLPPELAVAAGLHEAGDKSQQRLVESDTTAPGMGRRGYTPMIPLGRPIEVEGGLGDRRPSADLRKQRVRDSDSILLIDAVEIEDLEAQRLHDENIEGMDGEGDKDDMDDEQQQEEDQEDEEEEQMVEDPRATFKARQEQHLWHKERMYGTKNHLPKGPSTVHSIESSQKLSGGSSRTVFDPIAVSTDRNIQSYPQAGDTFAATESGKCSGEFPATHRELFSRPRATSKPLAEERRDLDNIRSQSGNLCQDAESNPKDGIDEGESHPKMRSEREEQLQSYKDNHDGDEISAEEHGQSAGHRVDDFNATTSREVQIRDRSPREVEVESSGCSSKRQRVVSPEGSHTASWDNCDVQKSARSGAYIKESRDSGESAMDSRQDALHYRKKFKSYPNVSRGDHYRDSRQESESHHKKQASTFNRHDVENEIHVHADSLQETKKRPKQGIAEKVTSKDSSRHWKDRDDVHGKGREEEFERKGYLAKEMQHYKDKAGNRAESRKKDEEDREAAYYRDRGGSRPESRRKEEVEKRDRQDSRRRDTEDRRDRLDKDNQHRENRDNQHREKESDPSNWHNSERRKKEEDYRRKDRSEEGSEYTKKESSEYSKKERERNTSERHERESDQHMRRKEEESWKREKLEDHHRAKARDGSKGDNEDSRPRNIEYQDSHGRVYKDEEKAVQAGRSSRRHDEDRAWRGRDDSRLSDSTRSAELRSHSKDKRKDLDDHGKDKSRLHEGRARPTSDREGLQISESHDRDSGKHGRLSDDLRIPERRVHSDKHKSDAKKSKGFDKELNDVASQLEDHSNARRKKTTTDKNELANRRRLEDSVTVRTRDSQTTVTRAHPEEAKEPNDSKSGKLSTKVRQLNAGEKGSSEEDEQQKGRSKLERWASHKDLEMNASERLPALSMPKKDEKSRNSSMSRERQRRDSSGLHNDLDQENRQHAGVDRKGGKVSTSEEQVNGKASKPDEKGSSMVHSKEVDAIMDDKDFVELPEHNREDPAMPRTNMAAKLEKRKERFKVPVEDKDALRKLDYEDNQLMDKDDSRQERPPRKRRWASG